MHRPQEWDDVFAVNATQITMKKPAILDFGAAGKGYLVDIISEIIKENGFDSFCVDASGDMYYQNKDLAPMNVGLEHPINSNQAIGIAQICNNSICGSAGNRRAWGNFHHIIDPHTLQSPNDILAVWAIADSALLADALTTCLFFVKPEKLTSDFNFEYALMYANNSVDASIDFPGNFFS